MRWAQPCRVLIVAASAGVLLGMALWQSGTPVRVPAPPPADSRWHWAAAAPGMNIYYAERGPWRGEVVPVWVDRKLFNNASEIDKDLVEAWDFDCGRQRVRQPELGAGRAREPAAWRSASSGTALQRTLHSVCVDALPPGGS
jgi:hypothetical protein